MKFDELYNRVYLNEQDKEVSAEEAPEEVSDTTSIANPEDFNDVEPMPKLEPVATTAPEDKEQAAQGKTLKDYVDMLEEFADNLISLEGDSLQKLVHTLDKPGTPFDGISARTTEIIRASESLRSISEKLKVFIISAAKA
jgi:hypothetical protein